jgi:hypothetical protein
MFAIERGVIFPERGGFVMNAEKILRLLRLLFALLVSVYIVMMCLLHSERRIAPLGAF